MANEISKQEYLKRYLEDNKDSVRKRKKKSKTNANIPRLKIIDQDIDLKSIDFGNKSDEEDDDEAPVIAEVIDDRPPEMRELESSRWKKIENVSYVNSHELRKASSYKIKDLGVSSQKHLSDPAKSTPCSPPMITKSVQNSKRTRHDSDNDISPPRIQKEKISHKRHDSGSDISPPRVQKGKISVKRHDSGSDRSPPRNPKQSSNKRRPSSDSDTSPPRRINRNNSSGHDSDSDMSPPRRKDNRIPSTSRKGTHSKNSEAVKTFSRHSSDFPGKLRTKPNQSRESRVQKSKRSSDSDISPPRSKSSMETLQGEKKKPNKTLSGLKAGLQSSETLRRETQDLRKREKFHLNMLDDSVSGRNADTVIRDKRTGLKRDLDEEQQIKDEENKKNEKNEQKYREWGKGIEQTQMKNNKFVDDVYEMSKPLARYRDDEDLEEQLKSIIHDDDPMSEYIKKKRKKDVPSFPVYSGPPAPPNRFAILPGYRWDGVDRSNGFEKRYFEKINSTKAVQEEAYLWSVQNM